MALEQFELSLVAQHLLTPNTLHLEFVRTDQKVLEFTSGQFISFLLTDKEGQLKRRSYSIASYPGEHKLAIAVSLVQGGMASAIFANLKPGDTLKAMGPAGRLILQNEPVKRYILIGTGTGIAPYRAMLPDLAQRMQQEQLAVEVILGVQYRHDLLYAQDFLEFAKAHPSLHFHAHYSREQEAPFADFEHQGYVQTRFSQLDLNPDEDIVYLCGNPNMIDAAFKILTEDYGFATSKLRREKYISSN